MAQAFDATVVEVDVRDFDFGGQTVRLYCEAMIMRSNLDVAVTKILDRLIAAAMSKNEFESLAAKCASQQLMAKADTERGHT